MPPIGTSDNLFHDGNPSTGVEGTIVTAEHLNNEQGSIRDIQSELIAILTAATIAPDSSAGQLLKALKALFLLKTDASTALDGKQPKDATLTALSGKDIAGLLTYLGLDTALNNKQPKDDTLTNLSGKDVPGLLTYLGLGNGSGRLVNVKTFTASGTYTPSAGVKFIVAEVLGGGGGGGSNAATPSAGAAAGAGGASGAYAICRDDNRGPLPVVIGAGGSGAAPAVNGASGNPGGTSSIGAVTAPGGRGGPAGVAFNVFPTGGNVANGSDAPDGVIIVGTPGAPGSYGILYSDANAMGGGGANSIYGAGGVALTINAGASGTASGAHAQGHGAGGGGAVSVHAASAASSPGGNGSPGIVIVWEYA